MSIAEEIKQAMTEGASTMFLVGLLCYYENAPATILKEIERAGQAVRKRKEVRIKLYRGDKCRLVSVASSSSRKTKAS